MAAMEESPEMERHEAEDVSRSRLGSPVTPNIYLASCAFNQDQSCFVAGTTAGIRVFESSPLREACRLESSGVFVNRSVILVSMLCNLFAMVTVADDDPSSGGRHKVQVYDEKRGKWICELRSRNEVRGVFLRRDIIVMVSEYAVYVYTTAGKLETILHLTTISNSEGLCALASSSEPWVLCCPGQSIGSVRVQVGQDDRDPSHVFTAHQTGLAALALNASGSLLATASEMGTVLKVFRTSDCELLYRLRRGASSATISSLVFRHDDCFLGVASSSSTVHIFKLDPSTASPEGEQDPELPEPTDQRANQRMGFFASTIQQAVARVASGATAERVGQVVNGVASSAAAERVSDAVRTVTSSEVVKGVMPTYFNDLRSFATFRIPFDDMTGQDVDLRCKGSNIRGAQLGFHKDEPRISVLHHSGVFYEASFRPDADPSLGTQECGLHCATTWFAVRPDFQVPNTIQIVAGGDEEGDEEAEEWQLLS